MLKLFAASDFVTAIHGLCQVPEHIRKAHGPEALKATFSMEQSIAFMPT